MSVDLNSGVEKVYIKYQICLFTTNSSSSRFINTKLLNLIKI